VTWVIIFLRAAVSTTLGPSVVKDTVNRVVIHILQVLCEHYPGMVPL
jgi:hypothetical protein